MGPVRALVVAIVLAFALSSQAQVTDPCRDANLPAKAQSLIAKKFPGWRTKLVSDLGADDQQLWMKAHPQECPGIAIGHFEEPDHLAYALVLVPKSDVNSGYKIVVWSKAATAEGDSLRVLDHAEKQPYAGSGLAVSKLAPGVYSDFEGTKSVDMKLDAINVEWIEKATVVYYWSTGRYRTLQTAD
jgi:hypothetical protein